MKAGMAKVQDSNVHFLVYIDDSKSPRLLELKRKGGSSGNGSGNLWKS